VTRKTASCLAVLALLVATSAGAQGIKFHPGHYVMLTRGDLVSTTLTQLKDIQNVSSIKGAVIIIPWASLESSKGVYNYALIDTYVNRLKSYNKRLIIRILDRRFSLSRSTGIIPSYMLTSAYNGGVVRDNDGYVARLWEPVVMDRMIALYRAIGRRYDNNMYFEGIASEETTLDFDQPFPSGYSHAKLVAQYKRLITQARPAMPKTGIFLNTNWLGSRAYMSDLVQAMVEPDIATNSSNTEPNDLNDGQIVWTGGGTLGADYRGLLAIGTSVEHAELGGHLGKYTPQQVGKWAYERIRANYVIWVRNEWSGNASQRWTTGILPYLRTNPPVVTKCPTSYGICLK
jgi:hypothetical protein